MVARMKTPLASRLQLLFDRYNELYWGGRLPRYKVVVSTKHGTGCCDKKHKEIYFNESATDETQLKNTLLHEMAHAAAKGNFHGPIWRAQMKRLLTLGAPVAPEDLEPGLAQLRKKFSGISRTRDLTSPRPSGVTSGEGVATSGDLWTMMVRR
jgi:hypothetical protein